jgi:hypothetical protein
MKDRLKRYAKAVTGAAVSGVGAAVVVGVAGPGADSPETYVSAVIIAFLTGTAVALKGNAPKA